MNNTKKRSFIKFIALILIFVFALIFIYIQYEKSNAPKIGESNYIQLLFDQNKPIVVEKDNQFTFINTKGELIKDIYFNEVTNFHGKYALVTQKNEEEVNYLIINRQLEVKMESSKPITRFIEQDLWLVEGVLYTDDLKPVTASEMEVKPLSGSYFIYEENTDIGIEHGIINLENEKVFSINVPFTVNYEYTNTKYLPFALITYLDDNKQPVYLIRNLKDNKTVLKTNEFINYLKDNTFQTKNQVVYYLNNDVSFAVSDLNANIKPINNTPHLIKYLNFNLEEVYYNLNEDKEVDYIMTYSPFYELTNYQDFSINNRYGVMQNNNVIIDPVYDDISPLHESIYDYLKATTTKQLILLTNKNETRLYNLKTKKTLTTFNTNHVETTKSPFLIYLDNATNEQVVYNVLTSEQTSFDANKTITAYTNYLVVEDQETTVYNNKFELIYEN